jgi:hypothetical protein
VGATRERVATYQDGHRQITLGDDIPDPYDH